MAIIPFSPIGFTVLAIFLASLLLIIFEVQLGMDKFKPALLMMSSVVVLGIYYLFFSDDPDGFQALKQMQSETKEGLFALIAFMAFMWMIVEILNERNVFGALTEFLMDCGLGPKGMFWAMGGLCALLSPIISSLTTAMVFGRSIRNISANAKYTHVVLCNIIVASNSGVWFVGTSTSLMVILSGRLNLLDLLMLIPSSIVGWMLSAAVLQVMYLTPLGTDGLIKTQQDREAARLAYVRRRAEDQIHTAHARGTMKPGGMSLTIVSILAIVNAMLFNLLLHVDIEFALGAGLGFIAIYIGYLRSKGITIDLNVQLQKVEWTTLMYYIGIITGVAVLNHVGWLEYLAHLFDVFPPTTANVLIGLASSAVDNNLVEAAALMSNPTLDHNQWALNAMMVGIGGSLTVVGSAAGVMAMSIEKTYTFSVHLRFLPAVLANFLGSLGVWFLQFEVLHWV
jgi:Na+/H+ antiporter NhaD/arsenite permease-like protein